MSDQADTLHPHLEETARSIAELHADHDREATPYERAIGAVTQRLTRPLGVTAILAGVAIWIAANEMLPRFGLLAIDAPPFGILQGFVTLAALLMTILILTSQRYDYRLAERRSQLTLQYVMVSEQKVAKLIELVEHQRRDNPQIADRDDNEASAMARPADGKRIASAVAEYHEDMVSKEPDRT